MRLRLNTTLRAALIAAITAVGFTLTQAQADPVQLHITAPANQKLEGGNSGINWDTAGIGNLSSWSLTFDLYENRDFGNNALFGSNGSSTCGGDTLYTTANGAITLTAGGSSISSANGSVVKQQNTKVILTYVADYDQRGNSLNKGQYTLTVGNAAAVTLDVANDNNTTFIKNGASRLWTNNGNEKFYNITLTQLDNNEVVLPIYTWTGATNKTWDTATQNWTLNGEPAAYSDGSDVVFTVEGMPGFGEAINIESNITAGAMSVEDSYYTFALSNNAALSMTSLTISSGSWVGFNGAGTVTPGLAIEAAEATISIDDGTTLDLGGYAHTIAGLSIGEDAVVTTTNNSGSGCVSGEIDIEAGGTFKVIGGHDAFGYNDGATDTIVMEGAQNKLATLELNQNTGNSVTMTTDIVMHGYSQIKSAEGTKGFNTYGCSITVDGTNNTIDVLDMRSGGVTITVAPDADHPELGAELEIKKVTLNSNSGDGTVLVKAGEGLLSLTGESNLSKGLNITAGTVDLSGTVSLSALTVGTNGTLRVSGGSTTVGGTNTISNTVSVTGGALALNGTFDLSGISHEPGDVKYYKDANPETEPTANGFAKATVEARLISGNTNSVTIGQDAVLTLDGAAVTYDSSTGKVASNGELTLTTFYINEASETLSDIQKVSPSAAVTMAGGTTLNVDADMAAAITVTSGKGTVNISAGKTVTGTKSNITLTGAGTYALDAGTQSLGTGTTLGQDWTGIVCINQLTAETGNLQTVFANLSNNGNGSVEVNNVKGWLGGGVSTNLILTGTNEGGTGTALLISNGSSNTEYTFSGKVSGAGDFVYEPGKPDKMTFTFTGDVEGWTGSYIANNASKTSTLKFSGSATAVNAEIAKNGGTLNVVVGDGTSEFATAFSQNVLANTLTVNDKAEATFAAAATFDSLAGTGKVIVDEDGILTVNETVGADVSIEAKDGSTINADIEASKVEIAAKATASFVQGVSDSASGVIFQNGDDSPVTVENTGEQKLQYGIDKENAKVSADALLLFMAANDVEVKNQVVVDTVTNFGDGGNLTLTHVDTAVLQNIAATTGDVTLQNVSADPIVLSSVTIGQENTVAVYTDELASNEGTITIQDTLTAGKDGILLANLTMSDLNQDGELLLNVNGGNDNALTLGSAFKIEGETLVNLDQATLSAIADLTEGQEVILIKALQGNGHELTSNLQNGALASLYFNGVASPEYTMVVNANEIAITKAGAIPEPTTGTLSLLALAALAARRRRK